MGQCLTTDIPHDVEYIDYEKLLEKCQTGDIILWSGKGVDSSVIRAASGSRWSHIGMVYRPTPSQLQKHPHWPPLLLYESNRGVHPRDATINKHTDGIRLSDLRKKVVLYNGFFVALRQIEDVANEEEFHKNVTKHLQSKKRELYTESPVELVASVFGANFVDMPGDSCVELIADTLMEIGVLEKRKAANNYNLNNFTWEMDEQLPYTHTGNGCFGKEIYAFVPKYLKSLEE
jgi:hypothetical protein